MALDTGMDLPAAIEAYPENQNWLPVEIICLTSGFSLLPTLQFCPKPKIKQMGRKEKKALESSCFLNGFKMLQKYINIRKTRKCLWK